ncbi:hypothetical protein HID58_004407 [Brassica napus]|uniref:(rape) hypothetical protein n=1 Tax=Brassica napus TaxID=3708 RepID=A0A816WI78_BRANA|nr:uncharacterized protein BNAA02G02600D [Brassica napus]XP_048602333.1 uncharacterized protein LOC125581271 [Brassica napus]KAH0895795.1 hypothetical protein HID58_045363 [Brassica napus]KAH0936946.1 hypothetical protein HID58_004407 [Brassica napus]CAF2136106.1 unnamed protein product [Brassica napus]
MAEETVHLPDSPYVNRSWRRISTRKLSFLYTEEKILPNYLKSTGSCHDVCKYGTKQHEPKDKPSKVSPLKRVNRSFSGILSFDNSPLKKKKKALTKSVLNPSLGSGKTKKTVSDTFKKVVVSRRRELERVEYNKRVTALKLMSVAQTAAMALRRSTVNRNKTNGGSTMSSKRCSKRMKTKKECNVPIVDETCKDLVDEEKTLYVIKMGTGNETVESEVQNQRCVVDTPTDDLKSQGDDECILTEADDESSQEEEEQEEDENTPRQGKSKSLSVNSKSMKLRFKRGKYSDVGSQDNTPRKLKFKRGKIVTRADTTTQSGGRRSLKTKGTNISNDKEQEHKARSFKVVLKHQETQKKGDSRVLLFNKVIKKTANKLVETRKSKVKALVGAFESVISLQEKEKLLSNSITLKSDYSQTIH